MTGKNLFITGCSGFIGSNLIKRITPQDYGNIICLSRREVDRNMYEDLPENVRFIKGDILDPESYERYLDGCDIVIHLAALTGKAPREEYFRINTEGTETLIEQCRNKNIKKFMFISSIAAGFISIGGYYYAQSKIEAEGIVKRSGLSFTILRPTMVTGRGSPILDSLAKIAKLPIVPVFDGGRAVIQPVFIDDLTTYILDIIEGDLFSDRTIAVAGPERITMAEFIRKIHDLSYRKNFRMISIPARPVAKILLKLEDRMLPYLPFTSGQLSSFTNDGICEDRYRQNEMSGFKNVDDMLKLSFSSDETLYGMDLEKECRHFTDYLIAYKPDGYIQSKYVLGHKITGLDKHAGAFDMLLVRSANRNKFLARLADTYTSFFYKNALLRKKLLLLLAILESCSKTYRHIDTVNEQNTIALYAKTVQKAAVFLCTLLLSGIVFSPLRLLVDRTSKGKNNLLSHG